MMRYATAGLPAFGNTQQKKISPGSTAAAWVRRATINECFLTSIPLSSCRYLDMDVVRERGRSLYGVK
jgi:hypothetical protein